VASNERLLTAHTVKVDEFFYPQNFNCGVSFCAAGAKPIVQALLEELPGQFLTYMRSRGIKPLNISPDTMPSSC